MRDKLSLFLLLTGSLLYVFDVGSDIYVAITHYNKGDLWWFGVSIALVLLPSIIVNIWSHFMVGMDYRSNKVKLIDFLACVLQLSVIQQYWEAFKRWWKRKNKHNLDKQFYNQNDFTICRSRSWERSSLEKKSNATYAYCLALTCYVDAFVESAPQWCLQTYIMLRRLSFPWVTIVSTSVSLLSLAWSITSLEKSRKIRHTDPTMTFPRRSLIAFTLWQLGILVSRLSAIVVFAYAFRSYVFIVIGIHWTAVIVVILINQYYVRQGIRQVKVKITMIVFIRSYPLLFHMSNFTSDIMFCNFSENTAKILNVVCYAVFFWENVVMASFPVWHEPTSTPHVEFLAKIVLPLVFGGFAIGLLFYGLYYNCFNPRKVVMKKNLSKQLQIKKLQSDELLDPEIDGNYERMRSDLVYYETAV